LEITLEYCNLYRCHFIEGGVKSERVIEDVGQKGETRNKLLILGGNFWDSGLGNTVNGVGGYYWNGL
jgi:hypothetical protein